MKLFLICLLNITFSWVAFALFHTVGAIALATLLAYLVWYYLCQIWIYRSNRWTLSISVFFDAALTGVFIAINGLVSLWIDGGLYWQLLVGCGAYLGFLLLAYLLGRQPIRHAIRCTLQILKD